MNTIYYYETDQNQFESVDAYNEVEEHNEDNNTQTQPLGKRKPTIIYIKGLSSSPEPDLNGKPAYVQVTSTEITY